MTTPNDAYEWVTVEDATFRLGVSRSTVLRMIREGSLVGEKQRKSERDRREQFVVRFNRSQPAPTPADTASDAPEPRQEPSEAVTLAMLADTRAARALADERLETIGRLLEERARLTAERDAANTASDDVRARADAEASKVAEQASQVTALTTMLQAANARADQLAADLAEARRRRWYDPRTW